MTAGDHVSICQEPLFPLKQATPAVAPDPVIASHPVGTEVDTMEGKWGLATATFDATRAYRYRLSRVWERSGKRINFLLCNPSTADAFRLDPTVRRCVGFATDWSAGSIEVTNCYSLRSTLPSGLTEVSDPVGPDNDEAIVAAALAADMIVAGWGVHGAYLERSTRVRRLLRDAGVTVHMLLLTKAGHPGHPLYLPSSATPKPWGP
ncbi:MAG: DUF1643 domain-containing protein [Acidimicrobiales bacterium]